MATRPLLLKLERAGFIHLPTRQRPLSNGFRNRRVPLVAHATELTRGALRELRPLVMHVVAPDSEDRGSSTACWPAP